MSSTHTLRSIVSHRGMSVLDLHRELGNQACDIRVLRARAELVTRLEAKVDEQEQEIASLREQLADATRRRDTVNAKAGQYDGAEARARAAEQEVRSLRTEVNALQAFKANATAVSDLPQHVSTQPMPTVQRFETGPVLRAGASPLAVVDPGQIRRTTWGRANDAGDETQPLPKLPPAA